MTKNSLIITRTHRSATRRLGGAERTWRRAEKVHSPAVANNKIRVCVCGPSAAAVHLALHAIDCTEREGQAGKGGRAGVARRGAGRNGESAPSLSGYRLLCVRILANASAAMMHFAMQADADANKKKHAPLPLPGNAASCECRLNWCSALRIAAVRRRPRRKSRRPPNPSRDCPRAKINKKNSSESHPLPSHMLSPTENGDCCLLHEFMHSRPKRGAACRSAFKVTPLRGVCTKKADGSLLKAGLGLPPNFPLRWCESLRIANLRMIWITRKLILAAVSCDG